MTITDVPDVPLGKIHLVTVEMSKFTTMSFHMNRESVWWVYCRCGEQSPHSLGWPKARVMRWKRRHRCKP